MARDFDLAVVLSVTTGRLLSRFATVHALLDYMTGDTLFTHQLPRACGECAPALLDQHPRLAEAVPPEVLDSEDACGAWVTSVAATVGARLQVSPLAPEDHTVIHPVDELLLRGVPAERIVTIAHGDVAP